MTKDALGELVAALAAHPQPLASWTPRELAEVVWFAATCGPLSTPGPVEAPPIQHEVQTEPPPSEVSEPTDSATEPDPVEADVAFADEHTEDSSAGASSGADVSRVTPAVAKTAPTFRALPMARALHGLATRRARGVLELDVPATIARIARARAFLPVLRRRERPTTHLVVLRDRAGQLEPWRSDVDHLHRVIEEFGSFASHVALDVDLSDQATVSCSTPLEGALRSGLDNIILVVSDGVGAAVASGALGRLVATLPREGVCVAWLHVWDAWRWRRSGLARLMEDDGGGRAVAVATLSTEGVAGLARWVHGRGRGALALAWFPDFMSQPRRTRGAEADPVDWLERARRFAAAAEWPSVQLLALAAVVPGYANLDLLRALGARFARDLGVATVERFHMAEVLASGFLERVKEPRRDLVVKFKSDDARNAISSYLDRKHISRVLEFLLDQYLSSGEPSRDEVGAKLQIPLLVLTALLRGERGPAVPVSQSKLEGFRVLLPLLEGLNPNVLDRVPWLSKLARGKKAGAPSSRRRTPTSEKRSIAREFVGSLLTLAGTVASDMRSAGSPVSERIACDVVLGTLFARTLELRNLIPANSLDSPAAGSSLDWTSALLRAALVKISLIHPSLGDIIPLVDASLTDTAAQAVHEFWNHPSLRVVPDLFVRGEYDPVAELLVGLDRLAPPMKRRTPSTPTEIVSVTVKSGVPEFAQRQPTMRSGVQVPRSVARFIVERTLELGWQDFQSRIHPELGPQGLLPVLLDPACGGGLFLEEAFWIQTERFESTKVATRAEVVRAALERMSGLALTPNGAAITRFRLLLAALQWLGCSWDALGLLPWNVFAFDLVIDNANPREREAEAALVLLGGAAYVLGAVPSGSHSRLSNYPFLFFERALDLVRRGGGLTLFAPRSFAWLEQGRRLVEETLPKETLELVVEVPNVTDRPSPRSIIMSVKRAEPSPETPEVLVGSVKTPQVSGVDSNDALRRLLAACSKGSAFEDELVSVRRVPRAELSRHPWSLVAGAHAELLKTLDATGRRLAELGVRRRGRILVPRRLRAPLDAFKRLGAAWHPYLSAGDVTPWLARPKEAALDEGARDPVTRALVMAHLADSNPRGPEATGRTIVAREISSRPAFALLQGDLYLGSSVLALECPLAEGEDLALLALLNSSTLAFWLSTRVSRSGLQSHLVSSELMKAPIPSTIDRRLQDLALKLVDLAGRATQVHDAELAACRSSSDVAAALARSEAAERTLLRQMNAVQEEVDWRVYELFGLCVKGPALSLESIPPIDPAQRAFALRNIDPSRHGDLPAEYLEIVRWRLASIEGAPFVAILESDSYKQAFKPSGREVRSAVERIVLAWAGETLAAWPPGVTVSAAELLVNERLRAAIDAIDGRDRESPEVRLEHLLLAEATPIAEEHLYSDRGLSKRRAWLEARNVASHSLDDTPRAHAARLPAFVEKDFRSLSYWKLRGPLDFPRERFRFERGGAGHRFAWAGHELSPRLGKSETRAHAKPDRPAMRLFDRYLTADYSGAADAAAQRQAIWLAEVGAESTPSVSPGYTRSTLRATLVARLREATSRGERVIFGIDHQFGWPQELLDLIQLGDVTWRELLRRLAEGRDGLPRLEHPSAYAPAMNAWVQARRPELVGPFFSKQGKYGLPKRSTFFDGRPPPRLTEVALREARYSPFVATQIGDLGAVGGQTICGLAELFVMTEDVAREGLAVAWWPFDGLSIEEEAYAGKHVGVEIYPTLFQPRGAQRSDEGDARESGLALREADVQGRLRELLDLTSQKALSARIRREGWVVGCTPVRWEPRVEERVLELNSGLVWPASAGAIDIAGDDGWVLRVGIESVRGRGPKRLVQFWIKRPDDDRGSSLILIAPDDVRDGLASKNYEGWSWEGKSRSMTVRIDGPTATVQHHYPASSSRTIRVRLDELASVVREAVKRLA